MVRDSFSLVISDTWLRITEPLSKFTGTTSYRFYFAYLGVSILIAFAVILWRKRNPDLSTAANIRAVLAHVFDRRILMHRSSLLDYRYALINHIFTAAILVYVMSAVGVVSEVFFTLFAQLTFLQGIGLEMGWLGFALIVLLYAFAYDTGNFFQHYMQHKIPILWEFHKVHHSAEVLTPATAVRLHPVPQIVAATCIIICFSVMNGLAFNLFEGKAAAYGIFAANVFGLLYYTVGLYHLKHSHIWIKYPKIIREIFASPCLHLIHHSNAVKHYDKNFGFVFTFWDRLFGSYYDPSEDEQDTLVYGISKSEGRDDYTTVGQLYLTPFKRAWRLHLRPVVTRLFAPRRLPPAE